MFAAPLTVMMTFWPGAPGLAQTRSAPPYTVAGNRALDPAVSAVSFAYMSVQGALRQEAADPLLCFQTATYHDAALALFNLLDDNLPDKPTATEKARVTAIREAAWRLKRGALALGIYCGVQPVYPSEWRVVTLSPGDRPNFTRTVEEVDRALDDLKRLVY